MPRWGRLIKRTVLYGTVSALGFLTFDDYYNSHRVQRNLRALYTSIRIIYEYKVKWDNHSINNDVHRRAARLILHCCQKNGGLYIKFGQGIASMNHILPKPYREEFQVLHDHAPYVKYKDIRQIILDDLKVDPNVIFSEFDEKPVASASIAQVHKAVLHSGETVAVKIQKPYIANQVPWDLFFYRLLLHAFEYAFELPLIWSTDFTERQMLTEIDFVSEAMNCQKSMQLLNNDQYIFNYPNKLQRKKLKELNPNKSDKSNKSEIIKSFYNDYIRDDYLADKIYIPKLYPQYCSKRILTAEWCDGVKVNDIKAIKKLGFKFSDIMHAVTSLFGYQIFVTGVVHCDPHPGNLLVRKNPNPNSNSFWNCNDYQIVFLDHGLYIEEPHKFRNEYSSFWTAMFLRDLETMNSIGSKWGVNDVDFFASLQLIKPFSSKSGVWDTKKLKKSDIAKMQLMAKKRVQKTLKDTKTIPRHLIFIGRNMNLVRANNKDLGSAVNRVNILADYAAKGASLLSSKGRFYYYKYKANMALVSLWYNWKSIWKSINDFVLGDNSNVKSFEEELEEQMKLFAENWITQVDMDSNMFDA